MARSGRHRRIVDRLRSAAALVEVFFGIVNGQAIRRSAFDSVKQVVAAISNFIEGWNDRCYPFLWTKTADEMLPHATRKRDSDASH